MLNKFILALRALPNIGIREGLSDMQLAKARIYNYLILTLLIIQLSLFVRELLTQDFVGITIISTFCLVSISFLLLHRFFGLNSSAGALNIFYPLAMGAYLMLIGNGEGIEYSFFVFMLSAVIFQRRPLFQIFLIIYNISLFVFASFYLEKNGPILIRPAGDEQSDTLVIFIAASLCFAIIIYVFNQALENFDHKSQGLIQSLQQQNQKLLTTNEELERFTYIASHDLKTPLRNIISFIGVIERQMQGQELGDINKHFSFVKSNSQKLYALIEETLEYSKLEQQELKQETIDLNLLLKGIKEQMELSTKDNISIEFDQLPTLIGDEFYLYKLFFNLIENGIKYNNQNTKKIKIHSIEKKDHFLISIQDNGIGINTDYFSQIFVMFKRLHTNDQYQGTGIGLSMCKKIIETMNGKIWLESTIGKGTTFYLFLPK